MPVVSVIMPVYNASRYLSDAIKSILNQNFKDFEFIIIDDDSSDNSAEIVNRYQDNRIILVRNSRNLGVARTLNKGIELAKGKYIVRMDADDISAPRRLERQVRFMDTNPHIGISGGWVRLFGNGCSVIARVPQDSQEIAAYMVFENPLWHMTVIMRKDLIEKYNLRYDPSFTRSEDYDLWTKAAQYFSIANIPKVIVKVREHSNSATRANWDEVTAQTETILGRMLLRSGIPATNEEIAFHHRVGRGYRVQSRQEIEKAESWLKKLCDANMISGGITDTAYRRAVALVWFRLCANSGPLGQWIFRKWRNSSLAIGYPQPIDGLLRFVASIIWHRCLSPLRVGGKSKQC